MAKVNASTGKVIKKPNSDVHAPRDMEPTQHDLNDGEDPAFDHLKEESATVNAMYADQEGEEEKDDNADPEEELSLVDDADQQASS